MRCRVSTLLLLHQVSDKMSSFIRRSPRWLANNFVRSKPNSILLQEGIDAVSKFECEARQNAEFFTFCSEKSTPSYVCTIVCVRELYSIELSACSTIDKHTILARVVLWLLSTTCVGEAVRPNKSVALLALFATRARIHNAFQIGIEKPFYFTSEVREKFASDLNTPISCILLHALFFMLVRIHVAIALKLSSLRA